MRICSEGTKTKEREREICLDKHCDSLGCCRWGRFGTSAPERSAETLGGTRRDRHTALQCVCAVGQCARRVAASTVVGSRESRLSWWSDELSIIGLQGEGWRTVPGSKEGTQGSQRGRREGEGEETTTSSSRRQQQQQQRATFRTRRRKVSQHVAQ